EELNYTVQRGGATPLLFAARAGDVDSARILLEAGADVNESQPDGLSALVLAAHSGNGGVAALLLEHGADANALGTGYNPPHGARPGACPRGDRAWKRALPPRAAAPTARLPRAAPPPRAPPAGNLPATLVGATPYLLAAKFLEPEIMPVLVAGGADPRLTMPN